VEVEVGKLHGAASRPRAARRVKPALVLQLAMRLFRLVLSLVLGPPILTAALLCAAAAGIAQLGRHSDLWDMLTHFAPLYLAGGALTVLAGVLLGGGLRGALIGVGVLAMGLSAWLMAPEYLRDTGPAAPPDAARQLKLIQFNVWGEQNKALPETIAWIAAQNPDVVTVEEATPQVRDMMLARTGLHVACGYCDMMIFSRTAPADTAIPGRPDNQSGAPLARASFDDARGDYTVIAVHQTWPLPGAKQQYEGQILAKVMEPFDHGGLILAGDFNSTPWSFTRQREDRAFGLIRRDRALFSWPARIGRPRPTAVPLPLLPIDHVYAGEDWATVKVERGPRLGSDHYPLIITLARRAPF
jgi:endonuclease/exonuclease/phosphatase (EEP) superfamily protein YafD